MPLCVAIINNDCVAEPLLYLHSTLIYHQLELRIDVWGVTYYWSDGHMWQSSLSINDEQQWVRDAQIALQIY